MTFRAVVNKAENIGTESRIDRTYMKGRTHMEILDRSVMVPYGITTPHRLVVTRIRSEEAPGKKSEQKEQKQDPGKIPNFGKQSQNRLEKLARVITNKCKPKYREWMEALHRAGEDVTTADRAAEEIISLFREQARKHLGGGVQKYRSNKERKLREKMIGLLEIRETIKRIVKGDKAIARKDRARLFRKIKKTFQQTWHILENKKEEWENKLTIAKKAHNKARREWKKELNDEENIRRKKSRKSNFETAKEILEYRGGGTRGQYLTRAQRE